MFRKKEKFCKQISVLLILMLFLLSIVFLSNFALAQEINYSLTGTPEFNKISLVGAGISWLGTASDMKDGNLGSYMGFGDIMPGRGNNYSGEFEAVVTFASIVPEITKVQYNISGRADGRVVDGIVKTYLWYSGAWREIDSRKSRYTGEVEINGPWFNVEKVKVYVWAKIPSNCNKAGGCAFYRHLNELRALGPQVYQDIGLRVFDGTDIVAIAAENGTATSPLRIAKGGVVYGIVLVNPGDANDSGIRIRLASGETKALRKL